MQNKYLKKFKNLHKPPKQIYLRGDTELLLSQKLKVAIVGSRIQSRYGFLMLDNFFEGNVFKNVIVITGGAYGTDMQAVKLSLKYKIPLIIILASGVQNYTPKRYSYLFDNMPENCLLISENPDSYIPNKYDFVKRNRLIAAISDLIYINEASKDSGSLHTADFALDLGKDICCIPGRLNDETYQGCLKLIANGARLIENTSAFTELIQDKMRMNLFGHS